MDVIYYPIKTYVKIVKSQRRTDGDWDIEAIMSTSEKVNKIRVSHADYQKIIREGYYMAQYRIKLGGET